MRYLLARGYTRARVIDLVGERHVLCAQARQILHRAVFAPQEAQKRRRKLLHPRELRGLSLAIDGHNQLITLESALKGLPLVLADDGLVRDTGRLGRHHRPDGASQKALGLMLAALPELKVGRVSAYFDAPLSGSGRLAAGLGEGFRQLGLAGGAEAVKNPDQACLRHHGPVASADSVIIDASRAAFDLAGYIIRNKLKLDLETI